jgi:uncharacterized lipoprotein YddW (UPF0748 family)
MAETESGISDIARASGRVSVVQPILLQAHATLEEAEALLRQGRHAAAAEAACRARELYEDAYCCAQPAREGEFRGMWCHSPFGAPDLGWDSSIRKLRECGFKAVLPNMSRGGIAYYPSQVLPTYDEVDHKGDQIALCLAACRRYGMQLHVWKMIWNLAGSPAGFVCKAPDGTGVLLRLS